MNIDTSIQLPLPLPMAKPWKIKEVAVTYVAEARHDWPVLNDAARVADVYRRVVTGASWYDPERESFVVFLLNRKNRIKGWSMVSIGTASSSLVHPREVFRAAIVASASAVICMHNHPSGDPSPSAADIQVTRQLRDAGRVIDIDFLDHVIIGHPSDSAGRGYYSFRDAGVL